MRAVNLIPSDARRGGAGGPGRSGGAVYGLLAVLAALLIGATAYVLTANSVNHQRAELAGTRSQLRAVRAQSKALAPYRKFAALERSRSSAIRSLVRARFPWERVLRDLSHVVPADVTLTSFTGTATGQAPAGGTAAATPPPSTATSTSTSAGSTAAPTVALSGCARNHDEVARLLVHLRLVDGVTDATLQSSTKGQANGASGGATSSASSAGGAGAGCPGDFAQFSATITFTAPTAPAAPTGSTATPTAATG